MLTVPELMALMPGIEAAARDAARLIMQVYAAPFDVQHKRDASPVTLADELAEASITQALHQLTPDIPVIAEEAAAKGQAPQAASRFWLVDPLDGTREFVARNGEFTVNIALIEEGMPSLGVVYTPVSDDLTIGGPQLGAWGEQGGRRMPIQCRPVPQQDRVLACSRSHGDEAALNDWWQVEFGAAAPTQRVAVGSSLKFGLLARGLADVYPRFGPTMEWDIAAGHAVLLGAGGQVLTLDGQPLHYRKPGFRNPHFVAWGRL